MMFKKTFVMEYYFTLNLYDKTSHILGPISRIIKFENTYIIIFTSYTMLFNFVLAENKVTTQ